MARQGWRQCLWLELAAQKLQGEVEEEVEAFRPHFAPAPALLPAKVKPAIITNDLAH